MSYTPDKWTDNELEALEKRIAKVYEEAEQELTKEVNEYFAKFKIRDKEMKDLVDAGEMTQAEYMKWRSTQMGRGQRFEALRDKVAERYTKANEVANAYVNDATPSIYSLNRNYEAYMIEKTVGSCDFTLWDESTVRRLLVEEPDLMPYYPPERALQRGIDLAYGKDQITKRVTSGIIRGISPGKIANELMAGITTMNRESAVRAARTGITAAENAGRLDSWRAAENMGITIRRRWMCTKDARTRMTHGQADGQTVEGTKEPFIVGGYKMMFPGDKSMGAPGHEIYNCRCTTRTVEKDGIEAEPRQMRVRDADGNWQVVNEMSYKDWEKWKKGIANSGNSGIIKAGAMSGALTSKNDPNFEKRDAFAKSYYAEVLGRKREHEIATVARNSGFSEDDVSKVFAHIFEREHLFSDGSIHKFDTDFDMAQSWIRLREGKNIQPHDILLLKHELMEAEIMGTGTTIPYEPTHDKVSETYNYKAALFKYLKENNLE